MFTGIITDIGHIKDIECRGDLRVKISCSYVMDQIPLGASICCSGACLTVVSKAKNWFCVDVSKATLDATVLGDWEKVMEEAKKSSTKSSSLKKILWMIRSK